jgi:membrane-associated phospholipid phosphatase
MTASAALLAVGTTPGLRPPSRPVRAWLLAQTGIYALAASAAVERAVTTTTPIPRTDVDPLASVPGTRELVLVVGLVLAGVGTILTWHGAGFPRRRDLLAAPVRLRPVVRRLGQVGAVTRGVMFVLPGLLLVIEAWTYRRGSFGRVGEDVRVALQQPWARLLLVVAALGLAAFAAYELAAAAYRREPPDDDAVGPAPPKPSVFPLWTVALILLGGAAGLWGGLVVLGHAVEAASPTSGRGPDQAVVAWLAGHRTSTLNQLSAVGSAMADTMTCITVTAVAAVVFAIWLGRWRESAVLVLTVTGQLFVFVLVTGTVHRLRPAVAHLDPAPPTSSFPSGHTGAAVALYGCVAVIVLRELRRHHRHWGAGLATLFVVIPLAVGSSRMYRGMHFPTDVLAGAAAGAGWLALVVVVVLLPRAAPAPVAGRRVEART